MARYRKTLESTDKDANLKLRKIMTELKAPSSEDVKEIRSKLGLTQRGYPNEDSNEFFNENIIIEI